MFPRYKARNYPQFLSPEEREHYETYRSARIERRTSEFMKSLQAAAVRTDLSDHQMYVLEELKLWYESIVPEQ